MTGELSILIIGGYGTFGGRLVQLLADEERLRIIIAGRSFSRAEAFCRQLQAKASLIPAVFDRESELEVQIRTLSPDVVVDASGPFQNYGTDPYRLVRACIGLGIHYLDLADGSDFVKGVSQFDAEANRKGVFVLSGVSSFPVLTAAVVGELAQPMQRVKRITGGIAPSPYAGVGENVIQAIASYAGKPVMLTRDGKKAVGYGLTESMRYTVAPPGKVPLYNIRFSLVDVPDLQVIPDSWPGLDSIWMGAGPVPEVLHLALNGLAELVRLKILPSLSPFAKLFYHAINILRWGEHRGGMFVEVRGEDAEQREIIRSWHLLAEGDDGPLIPSMAIEAIVRKLLAGEPVPSGARAATHDLKLKDYDQLFARRTIYTGLREQPDFSAPLYQRILGSAWDDLPPAIQYMHHLQLHKVAEGVADIERGKNTFAGWIADLFGFPKAGRDVPVQVDFTIREGKEYWQRKFAAKQFLSVQSEGKGRYDRLICERFGPFTFGLAVVVEQGQLQLIIRRWDLLGIPLPLFLAPGGCSYEYEDNGKFHFHVHINFPLIGTIVRYQGWLVVS